MSRTSSTAHHDPDSSQGEPAVQQMSSRRMAVLATLAGVGAAALAAGTAHAGVPGSSVKAPMKKSSLAAVPNSVTGFFHATDYGADPTGQADAGPAINAAITAAKQSPGGSGVVYLPPGTYKIATTINMANIHPEYAWTNGGVVKLLGAGRYQTKLIGGEAGFGFIELVASNRCSVEGISIIQSTPGVKTGILLGRTGDSNLAPSAGEHHFRDILIYGNFDVAGIFALAAETTSYDDIMIYTLAGRGIVLARDIAAWTTSEFPGFQAKYVPLCTWTPMGSGNGVIRLFGIQILTNHDDATAGPLTWEYAQTGQCDRLYTWTKTQPHVVLAKSQHNISFRNVHQEWDWQRPLEPYGFYLKAVPGRPAWEEPNFRFSVKNSRILPIYGNAEARLGDFSFRSSEWTGLGREYQIDVDYAYSLNIHYDTRLKSISSAGNVPGLDGVIRKPKYRARTAGAGIQMWPNDFATADRPNLSEVRDNCHIFDKTLNRPLWSRNGQWLDATGSPA